MGVLIMGVVILDSKYTPFRWCLFHIMSSPYAGDELCAVDENDVFQLQYFDMYVW